ncbi:MAG: hypothetical protein VB041_07070, partial [Candidatus Limiplasma sp.]|nr:hypothetical protein [Candidatus Limiplasma sp.]
MRKILCLVMAVVMALALVACATAEESGVQVTEKSIGEGATTFGVFVQLATTEDQATLYHVSTDETTLLAALTNVALVAGEEAAWGFNVTTVDGIQADYDNTGEYWSIFAYDDA